MAFAGGWLTLTVVSAAPAPVDGVVPPFTACAWPLAVGAFGSIGVAGATVSVGVGICAVVRARRARTKYQVPAAPASTRASTEKISTLLAPDLPSSVDLAATGPRSDRLWC